MLLQINTSPVNTIIIQVYTPTTVHCEKEVQDFCARIHDLIMKLKKQEIISLMGDFNTKIGRGRTGKHVGPHGLVGRNYRGETLSVFAAECDLVIMNTFYKLPPRRLYTVLGSHSEIMERKAS